MRAARAQLAKQLLRQRIMFFDSHFRVWDVQNGFAAFRLQAALTLQERKALPEGVAHHRGVDHEAARQAFAGDAVRCIRHFPSVSSKAATSARSSARCAAWCKPRSGSLLFPACAGPKIDPPRGSCAQRGLRGRQGKVFCRQSPKEPSLASTSSLASHHIAFAFRRGMPPCTSQQVCRIGHSHHKCAVVAMACPQCTHCALWRILRNAALAGAQMPSHSTLIN